MSRPSETARLTKRTVDAAEPWTDSEGKVRQKLYLDTKMKGFGLCVGAKSRTFVAQHAVRNGSVRVTIGRHGVFTVDEAREEARQLLARMAKGENPNVTKLAELAGSITLRDALELFLAQPTGRGGLPRSLRTLKDYRYTIERYLEDWLDRPLADITRRDVYEKHQNIAQQIGSGSKKFKNGGTCAANGAMRVFRAAYNRAMRQHADLPSNPCINIDWFPEYRRDAAISTADLHCWYSEVMAMSNTIRRDYLRLVLFTGLRRRNGAEARWADVDFTERSMRVPRPQSGKPFTIPLSDYLLDLLTERQKRNADFFPASEWIFPAQSATGHITEPRESLSVPYTIHGLRHTFITVAESLDISPYAIKLLVNHSLPKADVTAGYVQAELERLRVPMQKITDQLLKLVALPAEVKLIAATRLIQSA
jgi:integrase